MVEQPRHDKRVEAFQQDPAPATSEHNSHTELGTPYLAVDSTRDVHTRWKVIQGEFVDDPRRSVAHAHRLVGELTEQIVAAFSQERERLESQWSSGAEVSTEDLRLCLQRYRAFFARLLPAMPYDV